MRHKEPDFLVNYRKIVNAGPPRCCHTCWNYEFSGVCAKYEMTPPEDFAETDGACADWEIECPF
jgi:hypothetical protein